MVGQKVRQGSFTVLAANTAYAVVYHRVLTKCKQCLSIETRIIIRLVTNMCRTLLDTFGGYLNILNQVKELG